MPDEPISGQLNAAERQILTSALLDGAAKPEVVIEVGTWLGGGSTLHILRALHQNGTGHLWGIEADQSIYERMIQNIRKAAPEAASRFTPLFGYSDQVIPAWLKEQGENYWIDLAFLDGGDNPKEQITEFQMLADRIRIGGHLLSHDAKLRKGKWLSPYLSALDNWQVQLHDVSAEGLLAAVKLRPNPSPRSMAAARRILRRLSLDPVELIGRFLPKSVCNIGLRMLPARMARRLGQGRK